MDGRLRDLFLLRDDVIFLNHGSFGACPRPVFEAYQRWQLELERQPVEFLARRFASEMANAREALAAYVGAEADDLVYVSNATTGLNAVAKSIPLESGDEVLASDHEYGALDRTWQFVCEARGACYVRAPIATPVRCPGDVVDAIWERVTPRTRLLFLSHITSPTGIVFPIAELVSRAREAGILSVIDGAHAPGQIPVDLGGLGADFYVGNCHKWMMAPKGAGFLHARRDVQALVEPLVVSWGWRSERPGSSRFVDHHEWQGTRDISAFLSVPIAIRFMEEHDWPAVRRRSHELLSDVRSRIADGVGLLPVTAEAPELYAQMTGFLLPDSDPEAFQTRLREEFSIEVPVIRFDGRWVLRVSVQGYNSPSDLEALVSALDRMSRG
jgi:isopenicillin-N epimerase